MNWAETLRTGLDAIRSHRLRSGLTMLGILIGIAAVILTVGLGLGSQQQVGAQISSLGSNLLIVSPGSSTSNGVRGGFGSASTLTRNDSTALSSKIGAPDIGAVAPVKQSQLSVVAGSTNWTTSVVGTTADWGSRSQTRNDWSHRLRSSRASTPRRLGGAHSSTWSAHASAAGMTQA